jgi:hypothetical protein
VAASLDDLLWVTQQAHSDLRVLLDVVERGFEAMEAGTGGSNRNPNPTPEPKSRDATFGEGLKTGSSRIVAMFAVLEKSILSFGSAISSFVEKANPNATLRWNQAIADLQAVIGRALVPVLEKLTGMVRTLADTFASLSPEAQKLAVGLGLGSGLGGAIGALISAGTVLVRVVGGIPALIGTLVGAFVGVMATMDSGKRIFQAFGSVVKALSAVVEVVAVALVPVLEVALVPMLEEVAKVAREAATGLRALVDAIREILTLPPIKDQSSVGAAARRAEIGGVQSFINKAYTSAFQMGVGGDIPKEQLNELKAIRKAVELMRGGLVPESSAGSNRRPLESVGRGIGGEQGGRIGRGAGAGADFFGVGPAAPGPRVAMEGLRWLFG